MKKQIIFRGIIGFPLGITLGYIISILISLFATNGEFNPCVPQFVEQVGSEIGAVVIQTLLSGILGSAFAMSSLIWEIDRWSIAKQTGIYFLVISLSMLPIAYITHWIEHSIVGFVIYFSIFIGLFLVIWITFYFIIKTKVKQLNNKLK